tara:strand:+ start:709 stop:1176 length:468 start_codon:yes stop_codon:yes gene_type:complete
MAKYGTKFFFLYTFLYSFSVTDALSEVSFSQSEILVISDSGTHKFTVDVAATEAQRQVGLMFRQHLAPNQGMLFDFGAEKLISMWMKNTLISLDMLFVDKTGKILQIEHATVPMSVDPIPGNKPALSVIELNAGIAKELGIFVGDHVVHDIFFQE